MNKKILLWYARKRLWCGLPWTFTKYGISEDRFFVESGLFNTREYEVRLYRIMNVSLHRTFLQKIFGLGTVHFDSSDKDLGCFDIKNIRDSEDVKEILSQQVEKERQRNRVTAREYMTEDGPVHGDEIGEDDGDISGGDEEE